MSAWMLGRSWESRLARWSSPRGSSISRTAPAVERRLGRTPWLKAHGVIRKKRYTK